MSFEFNTFRKLNIKDENIQLSLCGDLASWLQQNKTLVDTLIYYTDAGSRISNLDLSLLPVSQVTENALAQILQSANLPSAFELAFVSGFSSAAQSMNIAQLLSQTIVNVSISIISFLILALVVFFLVKGLNKLSDLTKKKEAEAPAEPPAPPAPSKEELLLAEIRDLLKEKN